MKKSDQNPQKNKRKLEKENLEKVSGGRFGPLRPRDRLPGTVKRK
ncbi:hypothetical protein [Legionella maioricensis]|nr:hypothetical protein [Legionella maioricensis]